ncbi:2Fe-2S iron-sulfur cluster binding domain-containing protein [Sphingomonas sp. C8-2]|jgi:2Fe-2S ferredoxin|nr:2Fe-2S iron-sulfur cluster binding domain-containing protein [Sphingomonas sp. C8-2]
MVIINVTTRGGEQVAIEGGPDDYLMELIRDNGVAELEGLCGGQLACATCHIYIDEAFAQYLPPISDFENELLDSSEHRTPASRLACQINCRSELDGVRVEIAPAD